MSKLNEGEVLTKLTVMLNDSYMQGYQDALNIKTKLSIPKSDIPRNKYEEDLIKAYEVLNKAKLPEILEIAVNAIDGAIMDIDMEANQEWHARITLESALMEIAEHIEKQPRLSIPKRVAEFLDEGSPLYYAWTQANELLVVNDEEALKKREDEIVRRKAIVSIYLASKALGVELVEVED